ncbi:MAG: hypothetical protein KAV99_05240 [Candidatus Latescibacteria bacterium]|nr:hypothetical protein [Candidatus Latescibacterota bacterium]
MSIPLQKAIVIGLGKSGMQIAEQVTESIRSRTMNDNLPYPSFLYRELGAVYKNALSKKQPHGDILEIEIPKRASPKDIIEKFHIQESHFADKLQRAMNNVLDYEALDRLRQERGFDVQEGIDVYIISPTCDHYARFLIFDVVRVINITAGDSPVRLSGVFLMPDLFSPTALHSEDVHRTEEDNGEKLLQSNQNAGKEKDGDEEEFDPQLYKARAYATLQEVEYWLDDPAKITPDVRHPFKHVWLVSAYNKQGHFLGNLERLSPVLADALTSVISDGIIYQDPIGQLSQAGSRDEKGMGKFYSSLGFAQRLFPREILKKQLTNMWIQEFLLPRVLPGDDKRHDRRKVMLGVSRFIHQSSGLEDLTSRITHEADGGAIIRGFRSEAAKEQSALDFIGTLERESDEYEKGPGGRQDIEYRLNTRCEEVKQEELDKILNKERELVDSSDEDLAYVLAFYDELLNKGEESPYSEGEPLIDELTNLDPVRSTYRNETEDLLGKSKISQELGEIEDQPEIHEVEEQIDELNREIEEVHKELVYQERDIEIAEGIQTEEEGPEGGTSSENEETNLEFPEVRERLATLIEEKERLEEMVAEKRGIRAALNAKLEKIQKIWSNRNLKKEVFSDFIAEKKNNIERQCKVLENTEQELIEAKRKLPELKEDRNAQGWWLLVYLPGAAVAGIVLTVLGFLLRDLVAGDTALLIPRLNVLGKLWISGVVGVVIYYAWVLHKWYSENWKKVLLQIHAIETLGQDLSNKKTNLRESYAEFHKAYLDVQVYDLVTDMLDDTFEAVAANRNRVEMFLKACMEAYGVTQRAEITYPRSLSRSSIINSDDAPFFFSMCIEQDIEIEIDKFFNSFTNFPALSNYALRGDEGWSPLENNLSLYMSTRFESKLAGMNIERLIFYEYNKLSNSQPPSARLASLVTLSPFLKLRELAGRDRIQLLYSVGVQDVQNSEITKFWEGKRNLPTFFSHNDSSKITAFCRTSNFSLRSLSQLDYYERAYDQFLQGSQEAEMALHHPDFLGIDLPKLFK